MIVNHQRRKIRLFILLFSVALITIGSGGYLYFMRDKDPANGIFVYHHITREAGISGDLYQPS